MNPLLLALFLTGPWRPLAPLEDGNPQPVINSLNDMLGDHWLELPASRPGACDGPCAEVVATAPSRDCVDLRRRVNLAREGWQEARAAGFALGEVIEQSYEASRPAYARLEEQVARTRSILTEQELKPSLVIQREWRLSPEQLLPGLPGEWPKQGAGFRVVRKTGRILEDHPLDVQTTTEGNTIVIKARIAVAPVEYCVGDISYRIEGAATFLRETTSGALTVPLPLMTSVALITNAAPLAQQSLTYPGER